MTATNHALTGAFIGLAIVNPLIALPLALLSHFVCDAIPHFGSGHDHIEANWFKRLLIADISLCVVIAGVFATARPAHWFLAIVCAVLATSPDAMWLPRFIRARRGLLPMSPVPLLLRFHGAIQWFERPPGAAVEIVWAAAFITMLTLIAV
jgi:hypothetical protein